MHCIILLITPSSGLRSQAKSLLNTYLICIRKDIFVYILFCVLLLNLKLNYKIKNTVVQFKPFFYCSLFKKGYKNVQ